MRKFAPTRKELKLRLGISLAGLALLAAAVAIHGLPRGPALVEVVGLAGLFFGGSGIWTLTRLLKGEHSDGL